MKFIRKHWHWLLPLLPAVVVTERAAYLFAMMHYGDTSFESAFQVMLQNIRKDVQDGGFFPWIFGSLFFFAFRGVPFFLTSVVCFFAALRIRRHWLVGIIAGAWIGTLYFTIPAMMSVWRPLFTDERMSSTAVIAFVFIPFYSIPYTLGGIMVGAGASFLLASFLRKPFTQTANQAREATGDR